MNYLTNYSPSLGQTTAGRVGAARIFSIVPPFMCCVLLMLCAATAFAAKPTPTPTPTATPDGDLGNGNTAEGNGALFSNIGGVNNTADGYQTLYNNFNGSNNAATGYQALFNNIDGVQNSAIGAIALFTNTSGSFNTAHGYQALFINTTGNFNTADGYQTLPTNSSGNQNVAVGSFALESCVIGNNNIAVGYAAGLNVDGSNNIDIGNLGISGEANTIRIGDSNQTATFVAGISGVPVAGDPVMVNANGQLGTLVSSARFKHEIKPMSKTSEAIFGLKPVTFRYNREVDPKEAPRFGLVAEEVAKVDPNLVVRDASGNIFSVRYDAVNAMLLNEFLKEHQRVEELETAIKELKATVEKQQHPARKNPNR